MKIQNYFILIITFCCWISCKHQEKEKNTTTISTDLKVDHFNIWVKNPKLAKKRLTNIGFTSLPDSLSPIHEGQGTSGRYFYFLNNYLELIFVNNQKELEQNNVLNKDLDFTERANFDKNGASPFSIALKVKDYNLEKIPFEKVKYHQHWMDENASIYAAKNSKILLKEPSIFVVYPELESGVFESLKELENFPTDDPSWKVLFMHPNGAKKITNIIITSKDVDLTTKTMQALNAIEGVTIKNGEEYVMELHFDNNEQGKSFDLRPELPLIINL